MLQPFCTFQFQFWRIILFLRAIVALILMPWFTQRKVFTMSDLYLCCIVLPTLLILSDFCKRDIITLSQQNHLIAAEQFPRIYISFIPNHLTWFYILKGILLYMAQTFGISNWKHSSSERITLLFLLDCSCTKLALLWSIMVCSGIYFFKLGNNWNNREYLTNLLFQK